MNIHELVRTLGQHGHQERPVRYMNWNWRGDSHGRHPRESRIVCELILAIYICSRNDSQQFLDYSSAPTCTYAQLNSVLLYAEKSSRVGSE